MNGETRHWQYFGENLRRFFSGIQFICYRWIVYSWRRSTVTDGGCQDNTSNTRFRDVQQAIIMTTVWIDDDETKSDYNQEENLDYVHVVTPSDKTPNTNDDVTTKTITVHMKHNTWQKSAHVVLLLVLFSLASSSSLIAHDIVAQVVRVSHVIHACSERHSSTLSSPFHPTSFFSHFPSISSLLLFFHFLEDSSNTAYSAKQEMESADEFCLPTGYETQKLRLMSSPSQSPWPSHSSLSNASSGGVDHDDTSLEEMLHNAHRVHVYHSLRGGLSVGQSSSSVSEGTERPFVASGQEPNTEHAQIRTLLDTQRGHILAKCQAEIRKHEFQANYDGRSIQKLSEIIEYQQEEFHCAQAEKLQRRD